MPKIFLPLVTHSEDPNPPNPDALAGIDHIVVLMMENRSFDHMLGWLSLHGGRDDVDGLRAGMHNLHKGQRFVIHPETRTALPAGIDPCHSGACTDQQLADGNGGFVSNIAAGLGHGMREEWGVPMGYLSGDQLPVYRWLAEKFCVADRWFASVPGASWPNRLYAVTGGSDGARDGKKLPLYRRRAFVRELDAHNASWRWYFHDIPTLAALDFGYLPHARNLRPFASFARDAAGGRLPNVSWIDPNFFEQVGPLDRASNDDHPPSDVMNGQALVYAVVNALMKSPQWARTLLIITYDEHGGFFDHVPPPDCADDHPDMRRLGVRVPAFLVSPRVSAGSVCHTVFDHTSILKTIFNRFCPALPDFGARVAAANDVSSALIRSPKPAARMMRVAAVSPERPPDGLRKRVTAWKRAAPRVAQRGPRAPQTDWQKDIAKVRRAMQRKAGKTPVTRPVGKKPKG